MECRKVKGSWNSRLYDEHFPHTHLSDKKTLQRLYERLQATGTIKKRVSDIVTMQGMYELLN